MELLDVLDRKGNITGVAKDKDEIYKNGLYFRCVHIWVLSSNRELLLQKRSPKKETFPNLWAISIAGHVRTGETSLDTCKREIKEELNLDVTDKQLVPLFTIKRKQKHSRECINNSFDDVYLLNLDVDITKTKLQKSELSEIKYFKYNELEKMYKEKDPTLVPFSKEHKKLFKLLNKKFK